MQFKPSKKAISSMTIRKLIYECKNQFTTEEIISSFILLFIEQNGIESNLINSTHECKIYHESYNDYLYAKISSSFPKISLKDIESVFENLIDLDRKKSEGVVYTPNYIIDFIINYSLSLYNDDIPPILCDPSCGSAGF